MKRNDLFYKIFFPHISQDVRESMEKEVEPNNSLVPLNAEIMEMQDSVFPIDPTTGLPENAVTKLLSPSVTALEKDRIIQLMGRMPVSKRNNLSDEDLVNMLPSRYNSTLVDSDALHDFYEREILLNLEQTDQGIQSPDDSSTGEPGPTE